MQIGELNNSFYFRHDIENLCENHLWFLKRHKGLPRLKPNEQAWCIDSFYYCRQPLEMSPVFAPLEMSHYCWGLLLLKNGRLRFGERQRVEAEPAIFFSANGWAWLARLLPQSSAGHARDGRPPASDPGWSLSAPYASAA